MDTRTRNWLLLVGDLLLMYAALAATLLLRGGAAMLAEFFPTYFLPFTLLHLVWACILFITDFYDRRSLKLDVAFFQRLGAAMAACAVIAVVFFYVMTGFGITPKTNLVIQVVYFSLAFCAWRAVMAKAVTGPASLTPVIFMELDEHLEPLANLVLANPATGYRLAGIVQTEGCVGVPLGVTVTDQPQDIWQLLDSSEGVVVVGNRAMGEAQDLLYSLLRRGITVMDAASFWEELGAEIPVTVADTSWFLHRFQEASRHRVYSAAKRLADLLIAAVVGLLTCWLIPLLMLGVRLSGSGPIFFGQMRVGRHGRLFRLYKFRSMHVDAENDGARWAVKGDPRITAFGYFIRHTHVDELPQLWNILKGEMSFIGPRPERPEFVTQLDQAIPFYDLRHLVKPGLTGWAQVNYRYGASVAEAQRKLAYDLYYVKNRSPFLDAQILLKTLVMIFRGEGR
jgi:exopolysaccharide biosynthesis polyprenyl glycosylphosphotransferase